MDLSPYSADAAMPKPSSFGASLDRVKLVNGCYNNLPQKPGAETEAKKPLKYMECLKNHAASIGGYALDGCGEFAPSSTERTAEALKCAACGCHRNFHRREKEGEFLLSCVECQNLKRAREKGTVGCVGVGTGATSPLLQVSPDLLSHSAFMRATSTTLGSKHSDIDDMDVSPELHSSSGVRKRFRTKFSEDQKVKMLCLAEELGWKIRKQDESDLDRLCTEINVTRNVFKVWMHNNKGSSNKRPKL